MRAAAFVDCDRVSDSRVSQPDDRIFIVSDHMDDHTYCTCNYFCTGSAQGACTPRKINTKKTIYEPIPEYEFCKMEQYKRYRCFAKFLLR